MAGENDDPDSIRNLLQGAVDGAITTETGSQGGPPEDIGSQSSRPDPEANRDTGQGVDQSDAAKLHRAEQAASRARDEAGRFAAKPPGDKAAAPARETLKVKDPAVAATVTAEVAANGVAKTPAEREADEKAAAQTERLAPPAEWKGAGKVQWDKLPKDIQKQLHEDHTALASARAEIAPLQQAIAPFKEQWMREMGSVEKTINGLGHFYNLFLTNPPQLIQDICRATGIDLRQLVGQPAGQPDTGTPPAQTQTPDLNSLIAQAVQQHVAPIQAHFRQTETNQLQSTIDQFRSDPKHPYFEDVKAHMGQLIIAGTAKDMNEAYDQATWANPVIRQALLSAQAEATANDKAAEVQRARDAAAASLRGSPLPNGSSGPVGGGSDGSIRGDLMAAMRQQSGAV